MSCDDVLQLIEPLAVGELDADETMRAHLQSCVTCAAALASAQRLETALKAMEIPPAPAAFTATVLRRIRSDRWQSEQQVDRLFNLAIGAAVLLMGAGVVAILNVDALLVLSASTWALLKQGLRGTVQEAAPALATYIAATGLLASAFGMWWWAERRIMF